MGIWAEIKMVLNSTLGNNLKPLDRIIKDQQYETYYDALEREMLSGNPNVFVFPRGTKTIEKVGDSITTQKIIGIPMGVTDIAKGAFENKSSIVSIKLPNGITGMAGSVFRNCTSLEHFEFPESFATVGASAFDGCSGLKSIKFPRSLEGFSRVNPFDGCISLKTIEYGGTKEMWEQVANVNHLQSLPGLTIYCTDGEITVE